MALFFASVGSAAASFSGDGFETTDFGGADTPQGIAIRSGGKIVVAGSTKAGHESDFALARFKRSGNLDDSFAGDGRRTTEFGGNSDQAHDVAIQPNGRIVVVGTTNAHGRFDFALARYRKSGELDDSFSGNGKTTTNFASDDIAAGVAIQENGRIVVVGQTGVHGYHAFAAARYKRNGQLDDSFSGNGKVTTNFHRVDADARDVAIQENGRIVVAGAGGRGNRRGVALARYKRKGHLDRSFAGDGRRTVLGGADAAEGVAIPENGRIVVAGTQHPSNPDFASFAAARLTKDGGLDTSFGFGGKQTTEFGGFDQAFDLALQENGRIVLVGQTDARTPTIDFALARYKRHGHLDQSFSGNGKQTTAFGPGDEVAYDVAFQSRRRFVVAGVMSAGDLCDPAQDFLVARYRNNGELDD